MADQPFMYAIVVGALAVLAGILFSSRAKKKVERGEIIWSSYFYA